MKHKMLLLALGLSLLFNVFVLIGFVQSRGGGGAAVKTQPDAATEESLSDDMLLKRIATDLKLDEHQAARFAELRENQKKEATEYETNVAAVREKIQTELKKDSPDAEQMRLLFGARADLERQRRMAGAEQFGEFLRVLTPQQRKTLSGRIPPPRGPRGGQPPRMGGGGGMPGDPQGDMRDPMRDGMHEGPPREGMGGPGQGPGPGGNNGGPPPVKLERFDLNHNGTLEADEMEAAQKEIMARHQLMMRRGAGQQPPGGGGQVGPEEMRRFDLNHDGVLDEQERAALQQFRRDHPIANRIGQRLNGGQGQGRDAGVGGAGPGARPDPGHEPDDDGPPPEDGPPPPPDEEPPPPQHQPPGNS